MLGFYRLGWWSELRILIFNNGSRPLFIELKFEEMTLTQFIYSQIQRRVRVTVIVINFEADYLFNHWTWRDTGIMVVHSFFFISNNFYYWLIWMSTSEIANLKKLINSYYFKLSLVCGFLLHLIKIIKYLLKWNPQNSSRNIYLNNSQDQ